MRQTITGGLLIAIPALFNVGITLLAKRFDYPDVLRQPTDEISSKFREGGSSLVLIWWEFAVAAILFAPLAVLLAGQLGDSDRTDCGSVIGPWSPSLGGNSSA
jgi:hypothetical protein